MQKKAEVTVLYGFTNTGCFKPAEKHPVSWTGEGILEFKGEPDDNGHIYVCIKAEPDTQIGVRIKNTLSSAPVLRSEIVPRKGGDPFELSSNHVMSPGGLGPLMPLKVMPAGHSLDFDIEPDRECPGPEGSVNRVEGDKVRIRYHTSWHVEC